MSAYIAKLTTFAEAEHAKRQAQLDEKARVAAQAAREKLAPLETRLARLLAAIPIQVQAEGLSLMALQAQLRARGRGHSRCHVGELADALRRSKYVRRRRWRDEAGGFRALWYPR